MKNKDKKVQKIQHQLKVTFENEADTNAVMAAMIGQGYCVAEAISGLSPGAVAYRMKLARQVYGLAKGVGFAREYRRGGGLARKIRAQIFPAIRGSIVAKLVKARKHPTAQFAEGTKR